jgi:hypothetical protein
MVRWKVPMFVGLLYIRGRRNEVEHGVPVYTEMYAGIVIDYSINSK